MVVLRSPYEVEGLRRAGDLVARTFEMLRSRVVPGARLDELDCIVEEFSYRPRRRVALQGLPAGALRIEDTR